MLPGLEENSFKHTLQISNALQCERPGHQRFCFDLIAREGQGRFWNS